MGEIAERGMKPATGLAVMLAIVAAIGFIGVLTFKKPGRPRNRNGVEDNAPLLGPDHFEEL
jgi:hypothetical protein